MNFLYIIISILLAFLLFIIMVNLKRKGLSEGDSVILPNIYLIIIASLMPKLKEYTLLILISYLIIDILNLILVNKKDLLTSSKSYYKTVGLTLIVGLIIYYLYLLKVENAFLDMEIFKNFVWLLIILYAIKKLNLASIKLKEEEKKNFDDRFNEYVVVSYAKFKNKYGYLIKSNPEIENLIYSFLIYENYLHGYLYQEFKNIKNSIFRNNASYGILNLKSDHFITDEESIVILKERLENKFKRIKKGDKEDNLKKLINEKYKESRDYKEIKKIYEIIEDFNSKK